MQGPAQQPYRPAGTKPSVKGLYLAVLLAAALLYGLTAQRGLSWQDSGIFQYRVDRGDLGFEGELGLALAHPLYITAGWLLKFIPLGELPLRLNLFSGLGMAVALANLAAVVALLTGRRSVAAAVAALLALAHTPWWLATVAEVYTWSLAGFTAEVWLLVLLIRRPSWPRLIALALLSGLGLCIHNFALLPLPVYAVVAVVLVRRRRLPGWSLPAAAAAYLLAAAPYLAMTVAKAHQVGSLSEAVGSALFGRYQAQVVGAAAAAYGKANFALIAMNLLNVLPPLAAVGCLRLRRRLGPALAWPLWALAAIHLLFAGRYFVPDQFTFFLPTYAMLALLAGVGMESLLRRGAGWRRAAWIGCAGSIVLMPVFYAAAPGLAGRFAPSAVRRRRQLPFRNEARYWLTPWKHNEDSAERFARAALGQVEPDAVIVAGPTSFYPLAMTQRLYHLRRDVLVLTALEPWRIPRPDEDPPGFVAAVHGRAVYAVSPYPGYCPPGLLEIATHQWAGVLYRLTFRDPAAAIQD